MDYVAVDQDLQLPPALRAAEAHVRAFDPALRLRQSAVRERRRQGVGYILERKTRHSTPTHTETVVDGAGNVTRRADPDVRIAERDGYEVISPVHATRLMRPESIVEELRHDGDLATQTAGARMNDILGAQSQAKSDRRAKRFNEMRDYYRESFDLLDRVGDTHSHAERMRLNNAGGVERFNITDHRRITPEDVGLTLNTPSAGESPAEESSDGHQTRTPRHRESGQLHDHSAA